MGSCNAAKGKRHCFLSRNAYVFAFQTFLYNVCFGFEVSKILCFILRKLLNLCFYSFASGKFYMFSLAKEAF